MGENTLYGGPFDDIQPARRMPDFVNFVLLIKGPRVDDIISLLMKKDNSLTLETAKQKINTKFCVLFEKLETKTALKWKKEFEKLGAIIDLEDI